MGWYERVVFNRVLDSGMDNAEVEAERRRALAPARGRVLEVGLGTGLNLPCYPDGVERVVGLARDAELDERARARVPQCPCPVEYLCGDAARMPLPDASFDTVACTFTLCSIREPAAAVREMARVLRPGGRLLVVEHVRSERPLRRAFQHAWSPLQRLYACGCELTRETADTIASNGFEWEELERYETPAVPWFVNPVIRGVARPG